MAEVEEVDLLGSLELGQWLKLPLAAMRDVGPAVQTLGGLLEMTSRETFSAVSKIADNAHVPVGTVRKHLATLHEHGWIVNKGREPTRRGKPRRTATLAITQKTLSAIDEDRKENENKLLYGVLPWWACCDIRKPGKLTWSAKAVLSVIMARLLSLKAVVEREENHLADEELIDAIEAVGGDSRFLFSLSWLVKQTGLTHDSITTAKRCLYRLSIVDWQGSNPEDEGTVADALVPNWDFRT